MKNKQLSLSALTLRLLALMFMLLDHMWATVIPGNNWMTWLGRLAFPIFAFQLAEGYYHTSDFKRYAKRLLLFGLIAELPFNRMLSGSWFFPFHQNVMFTLLIGLYAIRAMDRAMKTREWNQRMLQTLVVMALCVLAAITFVDYGGYGVMMILVFAACRHLPYTKLFQAAGMIAINVFLMEGQMIPVFGMEFPVQGFAVLSLPLIWLYRGEQGPRNKVIQYGSYVFYPLHMLVLAIIPYFF